MSLHTPSSKLSARLRPRTLQEMVGQRHLLDPGCPLGDAIRTRQPHPFVAWGPPGSGKSSLLRLVAEALGDNSEPLSAVACPPAELIRHVERAEGVLVIDNLHRLQAEAQDVLSHAIEHRNLLLLATSDRDPASRIDASLMSRLASYRFHPLPPDALDTLLSRALDDLGISLEMPAREYLTWRAGGDARQLLAAVERVSVGRPDAPITLDDAMRVTQPENAAYPRGGAAHYDVVTAFVKSVRGSDVDAALYWLACMLDANEEPTFIASRLCVAAAEDVGMADPLALVLATSVLQATTTVHADEARMLLAHCTVYVAGAPKSSAAGRGLERAENDLRLRGAQPVPFHLRQRTLRGSPEPGYSQGAPFSHPKGQFLFPQYLPDTLQREVFFEPGDTGSEARLRDRLRLWWPQRY